MADVQVRYVLAPLVFAAGFLMALAAIRRMAGIIVEGRDRT
jgi:hypothetical protein